MIDVLWQTMCGATTQAVYALLRLFGTQAQVARSVRGGVPHFVITSPSFSIDVHIGCSGFEGIFLFIFLLSLLFLSDWDHCKTRRVALWYVAGIILMFLVNALRIAAFFSLGYWAYQPHAWAWVRSLRGAPVYLFHSYAGWVFYLVAFLAFTVALYRRGDRASAWRNPLR